MSVPNVVILGVGNVLMSDEGVGVHTVTALEQGWDFPEGVRCVDGGTSTNELLGDLEDLDHLIVIDAVAAGLEPGGMVRLEGAAVPAAFTTKLSPHQVGIADLLATLTFMGRAPKHVLLLGVEPKRLSEGALKYLAGLDFPGNVRQLENTCRWITVMASGREVHIRDLPPELHQQPESPIQPCNWQQALSQWADQELARGNKGLLDYALPEFERIMIQTAIKQTAGRRRDAALLLGWGRNTLTRKIKELGLQIQHDEDEEESG